LDDRRVVDRGRDERYVTTECVICVLFSMQLHRKRSNKWDTTLGYTHNPLTCLLGDMVHTKKTPTINKQIWHS